MAAQNTVTDMSSGLPLLRPPILLMAEDEPLISDLIALTLRDAGFEVVCVDRGVDAIAELDRTPNLFAGLVTDIRMGEGQDGWAVARHARRIMDNLAVVYVTADSRHQWTALGVPGSLMVPKPFAPDQIVKAINSLLPERAA